LKTNSNHIKDSKSLKLDLRDLRNKPTNYCTFTKMQDKSRNNCSVKYTAKTVNTYKDKNIEI